MCNKLICFTTVISWIISRVITNVSLAFGTESAEIHSNLTQNAHMHTHTETYFTSTHTHTLLHELKKNGRINGIQMS